MRTKRETFETRRKCFQTWMYVDETKKAPVEDQRYPSVGWRRWNRYRRFAPIHKRCEREGTGARSRALSALAKERARQSRDDLVIWKEYLERIRKSDGVEGLEDRTDKDALSSYSIAFHLPSVLIQRASADLSFVNATFSRKIILSINNYEKKDVVTTLLSRSMVIERVSTRRRFFASNDVNVKALIRSIPTKGYHRNQYFIASNINGSDGDEVYYSGII